MSGPGEMSDSARGTEICVQKGHVLNGQALANAGELSEMLGHRLFWGESASQGMKVPRMSFHRAWCLN